MLPLHSRRYFKILILPASCWATLSVSHLKSTHASFTKFCQKLKKDENKNPKGSRGIKQLLCHHMAPRTAGTGPSCAGRGRARATPSGQEVCGCRPTAAPSAAAAKLRGFQPGWAVWGRCSLMVGPAPNPEQAAAQGIPARELQSWEKLLDVICNYKATFSPILQYTNYLPNLQEKWLVLSRETKKGTSWLSMFQRGMFRCTFTP